MRKSRVIDRCPNPECKHNEGPQSEVFYYRWGSYRVKFSRQPIQRFKCKECGRVFTHLVKSPTFGQHRPDLNKQVLNLLASGVTIRRAAKVLKCDRKTINRKLIFLARMAKQAHSRFFASGYKTEKIHFDEMETYSQTKLKPVSVALAVDAEKGFILGVAACKMPAKGHTAAYSRQKYPDWIVDQRPQCCRHVLKIAAYAASPEICKVMSDGKASYPKMIQEAIPWASHSTAVRARKKKNERDDLFWINHMAARLRADLSRLRRRTWANTKKVARLRDHLWLYLAYVNGYQIG